MIALHAAQGPELNQAEALWTAVFGDAPAFQRDFYRLCGLDGPLVLAEDGEVRSMLAMPTVSLVFPDGWSVRAGYVYALATHPQVRGRGYAAQLLLYAHHLMRERGLDCALTVPAQPSLFSFFASQGYQPAFFHQALAASPRPAPAEPVDGEGYGLLREALLSGRTHVRYEPGQLAFQGLLCPSPGSGLYRLALSHGPACAAVENWPSGPVVKELLCAPEDREEGAAAAAALCGGPAQVRLPAPPGEGTPFGAIRWLHAAPPSRWQRAPEGYLGLAFD